MLDRDPRRKLFKTYFFFCTYHRKKSAILWNAFKKFELVSPFYAFTLSEKGEDRISDLEKRAEYYASIIHACYPHGDIILLGWSFGALQAHVVADKLIKAGRKIDMIINIDFPWSENMSSFNFDNELDRIEKTLRNNYKDLSDNEIKEMLVDAKFNLTDHQQYMSKTKHEILPVKALIFQASKQLNENVEFGWPYESQENVIIKNSDLFSIFENVSFIEKIKKTINFHQPILVETNQENRLKESRQRRLLNLKPINNYQSLKIKNLSEVLDILNHRKTILLAPPGAGKTTTLKKIEEYLLNNPEFGLPVYINLNQATLSDIAFKLSELGFSPQEISTKAYKNLIFLLDSLDEAKHLPAALEIIHTLEYEGKIIIAYRDYFDKIVGEEFNDYNKLELLPLTFDQIKNYINNPDDAEYLLEIFLIMLKLNHCMNGKKNYLVQNLIKIQCKLSDPALFHNTKHL